MAAKQPADVSATELELKRRGRRRLVGAITLGLLAIVFLPMIFDNEPRGTSPTSKRQEILVQVPPKEGLAPLPAPTPAKPAPAEAPQAPAAEPVEAKPAPDAKAVPEATPAPTPAQKPAPAAAEKPAKAEKPKPEAAKPEPAKPAKADAGQGFVVQLGVFGDADNAKQVIARMKAAKLAVYTETIPVKAGNATRVRVGPYPTRERADAALVEVKLAGADGKVVPLK